MADFSNADKGLGRPKIDCYYDEDTSSVFCWKAFEERMSERLSAIKAQKLKSGIVDTAVTVDFKQKII